MDWLGYVVLGLILGGIAVIPPTSKWAILVTPNVWTGTSRIRQSDIDTARRSYFGRFVLRAGVLIRLALGLTGASLIIYGTALSLQG